MNLWLFAHETLFEFKWEITIYVDNLNAVADSSDLRYKVKPVLNFLVIEAIGEAEKIELKNSLLNITHTPLPPPPRVSCKFQLV